MDRYDFRKIEPKWQKEWERKKLFAAKDFSKKSKYYPLVEFPYPSGDGLHVGHIRSYTAMDVIARKRRMEGYNVLYPIGWDAFGLPTENYAIKTGMHPVNVTKQNTDNFRRQLKSLGFSFDWSREVNTTDPKYYRWTQWLFLQFFKHKLTYKAAVPINWCPKDKIGLANEEVVGGKCERCGTAVTKRNKEQWMLKITRYAEKLLEGLKKVEYLSQIKLQQENWIGRSEGAMIAFDITCHVSRVTKKTGMQVEVFTTRPDTIFGATYLVLAPENPLVTALEPEIKNFKEVVSYVHRARKKTEDERLENKLKTGVELKGVKAINPATKKEIPIWVADYVLATYGTGAIMAVPAHDERDFEFAKKFRLDIKKVVAKEFGTKRSEEQFRDGGAGVVFDPKTQKYAVARWKDDGRVTFFAGGVNGKESVYDAIVREVKEESGLHKFRHVEWIDVAYAHYFNKAKQINRFARVECLLFVVRATDRKKVVLESHENFELEWLSADEILTDWKKRNTEGDYGHYMSFLRKGVARAVELGYDKTSNPKIYQSEPFVGDGILEQSGKFSGMDSEQAKWEITKFVKGERAVTYKLHDWVFSRQRYWGEPIPIVNCPTCGHVPVPEKDLPVKLPPVKNYKPRNDGKSPLASIASWVKTKCPKCYGPAERETDVMPNWAGSSWYFLRYVDPKNNKKFADFKKLKYWMQVDWYNGGMEHVTLHLLYSRFWNLFLHDIGLVPVAEPYKKRTAHGLILGEGGAKMSKSKGNVVNPDEIVKIFGADALRLYEMFLGPFDQAIAWDSRGIQGVERFLNRVWKLGVQVTGDRRQAADDKNIKLKRSLHQTIKKVSEDIEAMRFNTAVSAMMIFLNECERESSSLTMKQWEAFLRIIAPFAPHMTEELWRNLGHKRSIHLEKWPKYDPAMLKEDIFTLVIQVNGKMRDMVEAQADITEEEARQLALGSAKAEQFLGGKEPKKVIYVRGRLVNIVV